MARLPVTRDDVGLIIIGEPDPISPALPNLGILGSSLTVVVDAIHPDRLVRLEVDDLADATESMGAVERLLSLDQGAIGRALSRPEGSAIDVNDEITTTLARLGTLAAGHHAERSLGPPSPWWAIEAETLIRGMGRIDPAAHDVVRSSPLLADLANDVNRACQPGWVATHESVARAAQAALASLADATLALEPPRVDPTVIQPLRLAVDPGTIPSTITDGSEVTLSISGGDVVPSALDLRRGIRARHEADRGELTFSVPVAENAYFQDVLAHTLSVRREDKDVLVGLAGLEPADADAVQASIRVSRHSLSRPLRVTLTREGTPLPRGGVALVRAASSLAQAAAVRYRSGFVDEADALSARSRARWLQAGDPVRAEAIGQLLNGGRSGRPLLAEVLTHPTA